VAARGRRFALRIKLAKSKDKSARYARVSHGAKTSRNPLRAVT